MSKIRLKKSQAAQGMVEFALVLPVLLLVILGVFAFGHLFFSYSAVTSASREAARWGSAVGVSPNGARYSDCASIRAAAVRVGSFAGVKPESVQISYDSGPGTDTFAVCDEVTGFTPNVTNDDVSLGDRIVVNITVNYHPIVPIVSIPDIALHGNTARTIIRSLAVGEAPTAAAPCLTETQLKTNPSPDDPSPQSVVGQDVVYTMVFTDLVGNKVTAGGVYLTDSDTAIDTTVCGTLGSPLGPLTTDQSCTIRYMHAGGHNLILNYVKPDDSINPTCLENSSWTITHSVVKASTTTTVTILDSPIYPQGYYRVIAHVEPLSPGSGIPQGEVKITGPGGESCTVALDSSGNATCGTLFQAPHNAGTYTDNVKAGYKGNDDYNPSDGTTTLIVVEPPPPPTIPSCPTHGTVNFSANTNYFDFNVNNTQASAITLNLNTIKVNWPNTSPKAALTRVEFGPDNTYLLWSGSENPPSTTKDTSGSSYKAIGPAETKRLRLYFDHNITYDPSNFSVTLTFESNGYSGSCSMTVR